MLVAFSFERTLATNNPYVLLAEEAGVADEMLALIEETPPGADSLGENLRARAELLAGLPEPEIAAALDQVTLQDGTPDLVAALQAADHSVAILTHSPERAVELALDAAGIDVDAIVAPTLGIEQNAFDGRISGRPLEQSRGELLGEVAVAIGVGIDQTIAVGSTDTDREMLSAAGEAICVAPAADVDRHCETVLADLQQLHRWFEEHGIA